MQKFLPALTMDEQVQALNRPLCCYESDTRAWLWTVLPCRKSPPVTAPSRAEGSTFLSFLSFFLFPPSSLFPFSFLPLSFLLPPLSSLAFLSLLLFLPSSLFPSSSPSSPLLLSPSPFLLSPFPLSFPSLFSLSPFLLSLFSPLLLFASGACGGLLSEAQKVSPLV